MLGYKQLAGLPSCARASLPIGGWRCMRDNVSAPIEYSTTHRNVNVKIHTVWLDGYPSNFQSLLGPMYDSGVTMGDR
ncbi:hypothetical protein ASPBRDRAFT_162466 [Aspergillus brasiliensis CBS 101740]|uniref:Uncharacterized protein n=1 Tax=Aspergillus brasiliensis (strain CBS 101740 / IMI 381727 / IBT 21946) TaxID=767769 RepID=A0A1L9U5B0_ASPBC|nr:hypothetical protein ASPBRDRAFT_162466 [Aspergillus brasiliensis CBS 101740]